MSVGFSLDLINDKYFHGSLQKNIAVRRKLPQSSVFQTMMCLKNSIRFCHFWYLNQKFTVEHEKNYVGYGVSYTSVTTRTFQTCKSTFWNQSRFAIFKYLQNEKTTNQPATLLIFYFAQSIHTIPAGNKINCLYQKRSTSLQQAD